MTSSAEVGGKVDGRLIKAARDMCDVLEFAEEGWTTGMSVSLLREAIRRETTKEGPPVVQLQELVPEEGGGLTITLKVLGTEISETISSAARAAV